MWGIGYHVRGGQPLHLIYTRDTCGFDPEGTDQVNVSADDLDLQPLADNGGPTQTHAITTDSAAFNRIPVGMCEVDEDQRGVARPQGPSCDIGAFELEQP
jgi:hypothetical protein